MLWICIVCFDGCCEGLGTRQRFWLSGTWTWPLLWPDPARTRPGVRAHFEWCFICISVCAHAHTSSLLPFLLLLLLLDKRAVFGYASPYPDCQFVSCTHTHIVLCQYKYDRSNDVSGHHSLEVSVQHRVSIQVSYLSNTDMLFMYKHPDIVVSHHSWVFI